MSDPAHDERTLRSISRASLAAYLKAHDWRHVGDWPESASVFAITVGGREHRVWVPLRETFTDYAANMERSIALLADVEQRPPQDILIDLKTTNADVVGIDAVDNGTSRALSVQAAGELMELSYSMLTAAARSAKKPRAAYLGSMPNEVTKFAAAVSPAPMDFSSLSLRLLLPEQTESRQTDFWGDNPFSRQVALSLADGLASVDRALAAESQSQLNERLSASVDRGVSANLCGALAGLAVQAADFGGSFRVSVNWAHLRPPSDPAPVSFPFSLHAAKRLDEASGYLRAGASFPDERIRADVVQLARELDEKEGKVVLLLADVEGHVRRIKTIFEPHDYQVAIDAHKRNAQIEVDGDLIPAGRGYELHNPRIARMHSDV